MQLVITTNAVTIYSLTHIESTVHLYYVSRQLPCGVSLMMLRTPVAAHKGFLVAAPSGTEEELQPA